MKNWIMIIKEFFKPTLQKTIIGVIIFILILVADTPLISHVPCAPCMDINCEPCPVYLNIFSISINVGALNYLLIEGVYISLVVLRGVASYIVSCVILFIIKKPDSRPKNKK